MSLFSSMNTAITGLNAQSRSIGHISDNIANSATVGYKKLDTAFSNLVTASNSRIHNPGGVVALPIRQVSLQGTAEQTQVDTNLSINGPGFFNVSARTVRTDGTTEFDGDLFSRAGDFTLDKSGYLVNSGGYYLNGQSVVDPSTGRASPTIEPIRIDRLRDAAVPTTFLDYAANLPASVTSSQDIDSGTAGIQLPPTQTTIIDPLGAKRSVEMQWTKIVDDTDPAASANLWQLSVTMPGGTVGDTEAASAATYDVRFFGAGDPGGPAGTLSYIVPAGTAAPATASTGAANQNLTITEADGSSWNFDLRLGEYGVADGITQFSSSTIEGLRVEQDGLPVGSLADVSFDNQGFLYLNYDNGRTVPAFKVPIALFAAPDALEAQSGTAFRPTWGSGSVSYVSAGERGAGDILPATLEASNVDIADEFTKMIVSQRAYSANARVVTTADQMLQETMQMAR